MAFNSIKQQDTKKCPTVYRTDWPTGPAPGYITYPGPRVRLSTSGKVVGAARTTLFNRTFNFRPGRIAVYPVHHEVDNATCINSSVDVYYPVGGKRQVTRQYEGEIAAWIGSGYTNSILPALTPDHTAGRSDVSYQAYTKMCTPDLDVGVMLGEARETLEMLHHPFVALPKFWKKLQRPNFFIRSKLGLPRASDAASYASNAWLTYRYGIDPLLKDISGIIGEYTRISSKRLGPYCKKTFRQLGQTSAVSEGYTLLEGVYFGYKLSTTTNNFCAAHLYYDIINQTMHRLTRLGVNPIDMINIAWELVPYSFVVDWWLGVGDWLKLATHSSNYRNLGICTSSVSDTLHTFQLVYATGYPFDEKYKTAISGTFTRHRKIVDRFTGYALPALPRVNFDYSSLKHVFDSLALTWQKMPKLPRA